MPTSYVFDSTLNFDKCFQNTPPPTLPIDVLQQPPKDWLIELENRCRKIKPDLEKNTFSKHAGPSSQYKLKAELLKQLSFIFYHISGHLHAELLSHESRQLLLLELTEDINQCTSGFHIRVNKLVNSLQVPNTLEQLLYLVRKNIVQEIAYNLANFVPPAYQVHVVDRVFQIAKKLGLGIEPNIQKDPYKGPLSDQIIHESLQCGFTEKYQTLKITSLLEGQLKSILNQSGYLGSKETGYTIGSAETMQKIIMQFLPDLKKQNTNKLPLFILDKFDEFDEPTRIYDVNWPLIRQLLFQKLIDENYFTKTPEPSNLREYAYFQELVPQKANPESETKFFDYYLNEKNYATLIEDLILIHDKFPNYWQKIIKNSIVIENIDTFFSFIENLRKTITDNKDLLKKENQIYLLLFSQDKEFILRKIIGSTNTCITDVNHHLLLKSVRYWPEITKDFFNLIFNTSSKPYQLFFDLLFQKNHEDNDLLMFAARYHTGTIKLILYFLNQYIDQIEKEKIAKLFISQNNEGWNVLSFAARYRSDALPFIFDFIKKNSFYFDNEILHKMFHQQNAFEWSFLQLLIRYQSKDQINCCLDFISEKFQFSNNKKCLQIIINNKHTGYLLHLAIRYNKPALNSILNFISKHIQQLDFGILQHGFLAPDNKGWHCLHKAACSHSSNLVLILKFIQQHIDQFSANVLKDLFLAKNLDQKNFLQLAVHYQSAAAVDNIFKFLKQHIKFFDKASLQQLFLQQNSDGRNLLSIAYVQPANTKLILDFINAHLDSFDAETIKKIILQKNKLDYTCLHYAARFHADSLKMLLDFIDKHFPVFANELKLLLEEHPKKFSLPTILTKLFKTSKSINLLAFSLNYQPESAAYLAEFLHKHADEFNPEKIDKKFYSPSN